MKKLWKTIGVVATASLVLAACSDPGPSNGGGGGENGSAQTADWPDPTADLSGTTLTLWAAQSSNTVADQVVEAFEDETGAEVEVVTIPDPYEQGIQTRVATGDMPDLAFWQPTGSMLTAINAETNLLPLDDAPWIDSYDPEVRDITGILGDTRYAALITSPAVLGVFYNKKVFEENGITDIPGNWDEMVDIARSLKDAGQTPFFEMAADQWGTQWWVQVLLTDAAADGLWERINANEEGFDDENVVEAIAEYKSLIDEGLFNDDIATATFEDEASALLEGDAAMVVQQNALFGQMQAMADTETLDETIGFFPISPSGNVGMSIPDQGNAIVAFATGDDEQEQAARQFLSFWLGPNYPDFIEARETVSLMTDVPNPDGLPQALIDVADSVGDSVGSMQADAIANPDLYIFLADMIQGGDMSPEDVAKATQEHFQELAEAQGAEGF